MTIDIRSAAVQLNPRDPDFYNNPYPYYAKLRKKTPIFYWEDFDLWCCVRHTDVDAVLRDRRFGRQILHVATREELNIPPEPPELKPFYDVDRLSMLDLEPPDHTRLRGLVQKAFMARQIERLRPRIAELSNQFIDEMIAAGHTADLLAAFATPIPVMVIAELLGIPTDRCSDLLAWSHAMVGMYELGRSKEQEEKAVRATQAFVAYLREYVAMRREDPKDDLLTKLIQVEEAGEKLSEDELIANCILLLNAGHEATVNVVGNGVYALLKNPDQMARLRANTSLTPTAVEELLRFDTPLHLFTRWVLENLEFGGRSFKKGEKIALILGAANRDPTQFPEPDKLNLARTPNAHVSLGGGIHYCLGAPLARLELQTSIPILLERLPALALAEEPRYKDSYHFHGLERLQVSY